MKFLVVFAAIWLSIGTTNSLTYPIFGTKRYNRGLATQRSDMPVYENGYLTNNGYYYYPHHEYHSYGMPTYRGEYKPKTYYYSSGPSYNYYNDREPLSNPLDDLHEEILQEDEQERQTDLLQRDDYEDDYYIDPNERIHDPETTNNFLRNMMEYNIQKEKQQRLEQLQYKQREKLDQERHNQRMMEQHPMTDDDYFSEIEVNPDDYQFQPQGEDNFDLQKYWDSELSTMNRDPNDFHYPREPQSRLNDDQDVEQLKSLSKHEPDNYEEDNKKRYHNKAKQSHWNSWDHPKSEESTQTHQQSNLEDDFSAVDYDDGSWINWDRKRSSLPVKIRAKQIKEFKPKIESHKLVSSPTIQNKQQQFLQNDSPQSTSIKTTTSASAIYGQKEKYPMDESNAAIILDQKNEENSNKQLMKSAKGIENAIYDTIKKMINIEHELKKNGAKMQKRNSSDGGSVVKQLDRLRNKN